MRNLLTAVGLATLITAMFISPPVAGAVIVVGTLAAVLVGLRNTDDQPVMQRAHRRRVGLKRAWRDFRGAQTGGRPSGYPGALFARPRATVHRMRVNRGDRRRISWRRAPRDQSVVHVSPEPGDQVAPQSPGLDLLEPSDPDTPQPAQEVPDMSSIGTGGRASIAGLVTDWETSVEAREHPETFIAWLHAQATAARQRAQMVPDLVAQYHGRGPSGHAGVPDQQIVEFSKGYEESAAAEADAYDRWAGQYAAYVEAAEEQMTHEYGREVIGSAHAAHRG